MPSLTAVVMQDDKPEESPKRPPLLLPAIAPKDELSSSASSSRSGQPGPSVPRRTRLPPRSRTGCWTCRKRKVKCDEGRPQCGQCSRLGHTCDYSPRLAFRDDTPRVRERLQDVMVVSNTVWDCESFNRDCAASAHSLAANSPSRTDTSAGSAVLDDLPPFAALTTDEEREKKAERSSPGTYNVVVNQESFQHLPAYSDDAEVKKELLSPLRRSSIAASIASSSGRDVAVEGIPVPGDPNTVVLPRFEDVARRNTFSSFKDLRSPISPTARHTLIKTEDSDEVAIVEESEFILDGQGPGQDDKYIRQFRQVVWKQLVPAELDQKDGMMRSSVGVLETAASMFPPVCR